MAPSEPPVNQLRQDAIAPGGHQGAATDLILLQEVTAALTSIASRAELLPEGVPTTGALDAVEHALAVMRRALVRRAVGNTMVPERRPYRLIGIDLHEALVLLRDRHPVVVTLRSVEGIGGDLRMVMCLLPVGSTSGGSCDTSVGDLFIAVAGAGNGALPLIEAVPLEWVRNRLNLDQDQAGIVVALIGDLARAEAKI